MIKYKHAFACSKGKHCPESNGQEGCPNWAEIVEENVQTGETRITKGCAPQVMQSMIVHVIKASNRPAAEMGEIRNALIQGFQRISEIPQQIADAVQQAKLEHQDHEKE